MLKVELGTALWSVGPIPYRRSYWGWMESMGMEVGRRSEPGPLWAPFVVVPRGSGTTQTLGDERELGDEWFPSVGPDGD